MHQPALQPKITSQSRHVEGVLERILAKRYQAKEQKTKHNDLWQERPATEAELSSTEIES
jgi:hypothetical protein